MQLPDLPPGCALDPGWVDDDQRHRKPGSVNRRTRTYTPRDDDEILREATAAALRDERVRLWRDLWVKAQRCDELERENRSLRRLLERATRGG